MIFSQPISTIRKSCLYVLSLYPLYSLFLCIIVLSAFLIPLCTPIRAFAAASPITITSETASTVFAKDINFQVSAMDSDSAIVQATLTITIKTPTYSQQTYTVPVNTPGQSLQLNWQDDISGNNFLFSGTPLTYAWMFHDRNDHWFTGNSQSYLVIDSRFQWQHLSQDELQVYWYGQGTDFGQIILSQALDNVKRISANLGSGPTSPITLWVYQTSDDFRGALPPDTFEWVGGLAYPPLNEAFVVVDSPNSETLIRDMPHELTHVIFHELVPLSDLVPTWFDEGLAVYNQVYHEPEMEQSFQNALASHSLLRFDTLANGFPANADKAYLAYAQSWQFMSYMYQTFGIAKMAHLIHLMNNASGAFEYQMTSALGEDSTQIENQWLISLNQPAILSPTQAMPQPTHKTPVPAVNTSDATAPWLISAGVLLILLSLFGVSGLFVYQRRRTRLVLQSVGSQAPQLAPRIPALRAYTPQFYIPHTPDAFEQYSQSAIPYIDEANSSVIYTDPSHYDPSFHTTSPTEQVNEQKPGLHDVALSQEEFPSFTFGQGYMSRQARETKQGQQEEQEQWEQQKPQRQTPQE